MAVLQEAAETDKLIGPASPAFSIFMAWHLISAVQPSCLLHRNDFVTPVSWWPRSFFHRDHILYRQLV